MHYFLFFITHLGLKATELTYISSTTTKSTQRINDFKMNHGNITLSNSCRVTVYFLTSLSLRHKQTHVIMAVLNSSYVSKCACCCTIHLPLFRCELALVLSLKPWLRLLPAALTMPLGGMSLPAVDTLAVGPGSLMEREIERKKERTRVNRPHNYVCVPQCLKVK